MGNISEYDMYLFGAGVHYDMYMKLGAHPCKRADGRVSTLRYGHQMQNVYGSLVLSMTGMRPLMK